MNDVSSLGSSAASLSTSCSSPSAPAIRLAISMASLLVPNCEALLSLPPTLERRLWIVDDVNRQRRQTNADRVARGALPRADVDDVVALQCQTAPFEVAHDGRHLQIDRRRRFGVRVSQPLRERDELVEVCRVLGEVLRV